jgi:hypothetical protein
MELGLFSLLITFIASAVYLMMVIKYKRTITNLNIEVNSKDATISEMKRDMRRLENNIDRLESEVSTLRDGKKKSYDTDFSATIRQAVETKKPVVTATQTKSREHPRKHRSIDPGPSIATAALLGGGVGAMGGILMAGMLSGNDDTVETPAPFQGGGGQFDGGGASDSFDDSTAVVSPSYEPSPSYSSPEPDRSSSYDSPSSSSYESSSSSSSDSSSSSSCDSGGGSSDY